MRIKLKKGSQNHLTYELVRTNTYASEINKIFAYSREESECLLKEKDW